MLDTSMVLGSLNFRNRFTIDQHHHHHVYTMPSLELKSVRNRKRTRSRLHLSSTPLSPSLESPTTTPTNTKPSLHPLTTVTNTTAPGPSSSSSDERFRDDNKSPASSISSSSYFDDENLLRRARRLRDGLKDTVWWGYFLLISTWAVFVLGMGGVCGVWEWSLKPIRGNGVRVVSFD